MIGRARPGGVLIALACLAAAGCGDLENERQPAAVTSGGPGPAAPASASAEEGPPEAARSSSAEPFAAAAAPGAGAGPSSASGSASPQDGAAASAAPAAGSGGAPIAASATAPSSSAAATPDASSDAARESRAGATGVEPAGRAQRAAIVRDPVPSAAASPPSVETLDFAALVTRLRQTKAIGLLTKVAVKNQSEDLLEGFRAYHTRHGTATLADLRRSYDLLFRRLHSLLEDADPPLARDIDRSRTAIWEILADPRKFTASHLMPGA